MPETNGPYSKARRRWSEEEHVGTAALGCPAARTYRAAVQRNGTVGLEPSAVLPVKQVPHRSPARLVRLTLALALVGVHGSFFFRSRSLLDAALWASIGEARLVRLEFKFLSAHAASFDRKSHNAFMIRRRLCGAESSYRFTL